MQIPLESIAPGKYDCQINLIDDFGRKFAFPRTRMAILSAPKANVRHLSRMSSFTGKIRPAKAGRRVSVSHQLSAALHVLMKFDAEANFSDADHTDIQGRERLPLIEGSHSRLRLWLPPF
jgi:hypothetical protein